MVTSHRQHRRVRHSSNHPIKRRMTTFPVVSLLKAKLPFPESIQSTAGSGRQSGCESEAQERYSRFFCKEFGVQDPETAILEERLGRCIRPWMKEALCTGIQIERTVSNVPLDLVGHQIADGGVFPDTITYRRRGDLDQWGFEER